MLNPKRSSMAVVVKTTVDDTETIVKRPDEPSGNVSRVYEPENLSASDEELQKQVESKLQELNQFFAGRGEAMGPQIQYLVKTYNRAAKDLLRAIQVYHSPR